MSATKDGLWATDNDRVPHKFDELTKTFVRVGTRKGYSISAGLEGHAVMRGADDYKMYGWVETDQTWKVLDTPEVVAGVGERGRLL